MASGLSASGNVSFPAGLRVLAVDDDLGALEILEKMLLHCSYQVTACQRAKDALSLLRENSTRFDILITEIQLPEMSGFQLLAEILKLPMNLPVVLFSADLDQDMAKEGIYSGACHALSKPISVDILKVIWQLAYYNAKRFDLGRVGSVAPVVPIKGIEEKRDGNLSCSSQVESSQNNSNESIAAIKKKRARFSWTEERHNLFVKAIEFLGNDKAVPAKISEYMQRRWKDPCLTRHVISSHLQKYRAKKAMKQGVSSDKDYSSEAPYSRDIIQHTSSEIRPMRYTGAPSPCSMQTRKTSNVPPAVSSSQSTCLDQDTMYRECFQINGYEPNPHQNLNFLQPSCALQQNAVGYGYTTRAVPQANQHFLFQDLSSQDLCYADHKPMMIHEVCHFPTHVESLENTRLGCDDSFLEELLLE